MTDNDEVTPEQAEAVRFAIDEEERRIGRPLTIWESLTVAGLALRKVQPCADPKRKH